MVNRKKKGGQMTLNVGRGAFLKYNSRQLFNLFFNLFLKVEVKEKKARLSINHQGT